MIESFHIAIRLGDRDDFIAITTMILTVINASIPINIMIAIIPTTMPLLLSKDGM